MMCVSLVCGRFRHFRNNAPIFSFFDIFSSKNGEICGKPAIFDKIDFDFHIAIVVSET